jgi:hypothetical protein
MKTALVIGALSLVAPAGAVVAEETKPAVQVHGTGPFALTYVNPADDPRQKAE